MELIIFLLILLFLISGSAILTVNTINPVHSVFFLILCFLFVSLLFFLLRNEFLAIMIIIIYIGAIAVLFLFVIMMIDIKLIELYSTMLNYIPIGIFLLIFLCSQFIFFFNFFDFLIFTKNNVYYIDWLNFFIFNFNNIHLLGLFLYTYYFLAFLFCSLLLFIATIGAILLTFISFKQTNYIYIRKYECISYQYFIDYKNNIFIKNMFIFFTPSIIGFKAPATPIMEGIIDLHNYIFFYLILVFIVVLWMYCYILYNFYLIPTFFYDFSIIEDEYYSNNESYSLNFLKKILLYFGLSSEYFDKIKEDDILKEQVSEFLFQKFKIFLYVQAVNRQIDILQTRKIREHMLIEIIWTIIPSIILILIAIPSFALLYAMDEVISPKLTVKAIGYQWFWSYEYAHVYDIIEYNYLKDCLGYTNRYYRDAVIYDSIMLTDSELLKGYHRLLEVDRQLILPVKTHIRIMVTGADVIHSWAVPSFGIKIDAVPGRMSQVGVYVKHEGVFYGQCSELCGVNHGFMPIVVKVVSYDNFLMWYRKVETIWLN
jgi:heme/copper-type cytochrome/quinol oxidase subunit 2/NADH:ubiquinone oxidoreductase subunit 6 (subunit J)